jgi:alkylation response protein AidB-like acyl-CoA dehydrogenase
MAYRVDVQDFELQLFGWLGLDRVLSQARFADWDGESVRMVLDQAAEVAIKELSSINVEGDREGVHFDGGVVRVPASTKKAWEVFTEGGWLGATSSPALGGLGLPHTVGTALTDMFAGANLAFSLVTLLTRGAAKLIEDYGGDDLVARFCERMVKGEWTGTMCLTEPHAGSDVGASTTRAVRQDDGTYLITGEKIFITSGEHDLADNIVHAVLARTPDAPTGTRGLSLFVVPKRWVEANGSLGGDNDVRCASVEHKLGIHASPTCSMLFGPNGACRGFLLGREGEGMRLMFDMMNEARIEVGVQGAAVAAAAHLAALDYAHERVQMRHFSRTAVTGSAPVAIVEHPDVRRMLVTSAAVVAAMRALLLRTSFEVDRSHDEHDAERELAAGLVALLTPVCKAWCSDWGFRVTEWSLQVFGGYGYTTDYPAEQYLRDAKITSIYEGTNGIQALDFVGRKMFAADGAPMRHLLGELRETVTALAPDAELGAAARALGVAGERFEALIGGLLQRSDSEVVLALNAVPILDTFGTLLGGGFLLEQAVVARERLARLGAARGLDPAEPSSRRAFALEHAEAAFLHNRIEQAKVFALRLVPPAAAQLAAVEQGETSPLDAVL